MSVVMAVKHLNYPVKDAARAKALYQALLGVEPYMDTPYYVGFRIGDQEVGLDPNGHAQGLSGPLGYHQVSDIRSALKSLVDAGATVLQEVRDVGSGKLIATARDADGNAIGLMQLA